MYPRRVGNQASRGVADSVYHSLAQPDKRIMPDSPAHPDRLLISIATYNERENLRGLVSDILTQVPDAHVLVVDDASPDGTGDLADALAAENPRVHVKHRTGKLGLGSAIIAGMKYASDQSYHRFVSMDAD